MTYSPRLMPVLRRLNHSGAMLGMALLLVGCAGGAAASVVPGTTPVGPASASAALAPLPSSGAAATPGDGLAGSNLTLTGGSAHVTVSGDASLTMALDLTSGILIPDTNVIMVWNGKQGDATKDDSLRIQAPSHTGSFTSSATDFTALQVSVGTGRIGTAGAPSYFAPLADECTATLTKVDATGVTGTLQCRGLTAAQDQFVDIDADFTAIP